jgi:hypothetical protein
MVTQPETGPACVVVCEWDVERLCHYWALHPVSDAAVLRSGQPLQRQRATRPVTAQPLQALPVVGMQVRIGVQGEALQLRPIGRVIMIYNLDRKPS